MVNFAKLSQISAKSVSDVGLKFANEFSEISKNKDASGLTLQISKEFLAVLRACKSVPGLNKALTDKKRNSKERQALVKQLLKTIKANKLTEQVLSELILKDWTSFNEFETAIGEFFFSSIMISLSTNKDKKRLSDVSSQLFSFAETLKDLTKSSAEVARLREFLSSEKRSITGKFEIIETLIQKSAFEETVLFAKFATMSLNGARFVISLRRISERISQVQNKVLVNVTVATQLTESQLSRLQVILKNKYQKVPELNILIDPDVLGGMKVETANEVIDNTILTSFKNMQQMFALTFKV